MHMIQTDLELAATLDSPESYREKFFRLIPAFDSLRTYSTKALLLDLMAGLTVAAVAVPQAMAYAQIAGIPPQYGLYTAIVMTGVGALFDSSKQLINGPTNAISIAVLSAVVTFNETERISAVILLALMVGIVQMGITFLKLGDLTRYISHAVIIGFTVGASTLLVMDQLKNILGLTAKGSGEDHFLKRFWLTISHIDQNHAATIQGDIPESRISRCLFRTPISGSRPRAVFRTITIAISLISLQTFAGRGTLLESHQFFNLIAYRIYFLSLPQAGFQNTEWLTRQFCSKTSWSDSNAAICMRAMNSLGASQVD